MPHSPPRANSARSLRRFVRYFAIIAVLPTIVDGLVLVWQSAESQIQGRQDETRRLAAAAAENMGNHLKTMIASAEVLAQLPIDEAHFASFYAIAKGFSRRVDYQVTLADAEGHQFLATRLPWGATPPRRKAMDSVRLAVADARPHVSELFLGKMAGQYVIAVDTPVQSAEGLRVITLSANATSIGEVLFRTRVPAGWRLALLDGHGAYIARGPDAKYALSIGQPGPAPLLAAIVRAESGAGWISTDDGRLWHAFHRVPGSDWTVVLGIPQERLYAPLLHPLALLGAMLLAAIGLTLWLTRRYSRHVVAATNRLIAVAREPLGTLATLPAADSFVEIDDVVEVLGRVARENEQSKRAIQRNEERLRLAMDAASTGLWDWDIAARTIYLSPHYYALTGYQAGDHAPDYDFVRQLVHPDDWPQVLAIMEANSLGQTLSSDSEYRIITKSGEIRWVASTSRVVERDGEGQPRRIVGTTTDITERVRADAEREKIRRELENYRNQLEHLVAQRTADLAASELRYRTVLEGQTEVIVRFRADGTILFANEACCRFFEQPMAMLIGSLWPALAGTSDLTAMEAGRHALSPAQPVVEMEHRMPTGRGELRWMQFVNRAFFAADGKLSEIQAVGRDITERKRLEEALAESRAQLHALFEATDNLREQQRKEIARDIHDQLGTIHTAIGFRVEFVKDQFPENLLLANEMSGIKSLLIQAAAAARSICNNLRPPLLDDLGLIPACRWYLQEWSALIGIASSGRFSQMSEEFPEQLSTDVYRVFQELLTNVAKHSGASRVRVTLHSGRRRLSLRVADNGRGFAPAAATPGYGLLGVRERMARQGGTVTIESGAAGTVVLITLPRPVAP